MEKYENSYRKSCSTARVHYKSQKIVVEKNRFRKFLIASAVVITCVSSVLTGFSLKAIDTIEEYQTVYEYVKPYYEIVDNNTHRTADNQHYWYDTADMATELLNDRENLDEKFYAIYKRIGYNDANKIKHLNEILRIMNGRISCVPDSYPDFVGYENFDDFLIKNAYVDKEGNPSREVYEEQMKKYISAKAQLKKMQDEKKIGK